MVIDSGSGSSTNRLLTRIERVDLSKRVICAGQGSKTFNQIRREIDRVFGFPLAESNAIVARPSAAGSISEPGYFVALSSRVIPSPGIVPVPRGDDPQWSTTEPFPGRYRCYRSQSLSHRAAREGPTPKAT